MPVVRPKDPRNRKPEPRSRFVRYVSVGLLASIAAGMVFGFGVMAGRISPAGMPTIERDVPAFVAIVSTLVLLCVGTYYVLVNDTVRRGIELSIRPSRTQGPTYLPEHVRDYIENYSEHHYAELRSALLREKSTGMTDEDKEFLILSIADSVKKSIPDELATAIRDEWEEHYGEESARRNHIQAIREDMDGSVLRLQQAIEDLRRRAAVNLSVGVTSSVAAISILLASIYYGIPIKDKDLPKIVATILPRIACAALIQTLSFFFLKLYRTTLEDIKFYQNEVVSLTDRSAAVETAFSTNSPDIIKNVVQQLSKSDRNAAIAIANRKPTRSSAQTTEYTDIVKAALDVAKQANS